MEEVIIAPSNSILFVSGSQKSEIPEITGGAAIWKTTSCVAFMTFPEQDGETRVILGRIEDVDPGRLADMDTTIETFQRRLIVEAVGREIVLETAVLRPKTRVTIWLSHPRWPKEVRVGYN
jgi:hypothetical protein